MNHGANTARQRVLLVARDYMFYTRDIAAAIASQFGAEVVFHPVEPPSWLYKLLRYVPAWQQRWLRRHHRRIVASVAGQPFDAALFIHVHPVGEQLADYRRALPGTRFVLYSWDSLRTHDYLPLAGHFDRVMSFDRADVAAHPPLQYLPLFFAERFRALRDSRQFRYDLAFVGTAFNIRRYDEVEKLRALLREQGIRLYDYVLVSPFLYIRSLLAGRRLRGVHFRSLRVEQLVAAYRDSCAVLDVANNVQSGYTMRTFEALGAGRKLVTTRASIVNEDFYTPESVQVLDAGLRGLSREFLAGTLRLAPTVENYSLTCWLRRLLPELQPVTEPRN